MYHPIPITTEEERDRFCAMPSAGELTRDLLARQAPDASWMLADDAGRVVARCSLWWNETPPYADQRLGLIGHYAATTGESAAPLLHLACDQFATHGCTLAVGPMDGNTWQRYRLLTERGTEPPFFLEPDNPDDWPVHFTDNGFTALAHYFSALNSNLEVSDSRTADVARKVAEIGIVVRPLRLEQFEDELRRIHALSLASFGSNFLYTPIAEEEFVAQYRGIRPYILPELILLAELRDQPVGYVFSIPDLLKKKRGRPIDTVIVKTLAVHPEHGGVGLGGLLVARCQEVARQLGYTRAIHALMHETNKSHRISSHTATPIRRYTLYAKPLAEESGRSPILRS
jgi:predicted N-acetyltransferase YhbS